MTTNKRYEEVAQFILENINNNHYPTGTKLPSEYELADDFNVSRLTVRKAIDLLIKQNILIKEKRRGTYVMTPHNKIQSGRSGLVGFTESAKLHGKHPNTQVISFEAMSQLPKNISQALDQSTETTYHIKRLRSFDNDPMTVEEIYIKEALLPNLSKEDLEASLFEKIEQTIDISYSHQEIEAIVMTEELATLLEGAVGDPVLLVHTITYSPSGLPILFDLSYYRADKYTFNNTLIRH